MTSKEPRGPTEGYRRTRFVPETWDEIQAKLRGQLQESVTFFALLLPPGVVILIMGARLNRRLLKYEFEHRSSGGVVAFETVEDLLRHERKRRWVHLPIKTGYTLSVVGFLGFLLLLGTFSPTRH